MKKTKITYYFDALCGWCYGSTDVIQKFYETYKEEVDFDVKSGGLFLGDRVGLINDVAPYIKAGAYKTVEQTTGVMFGNAFISEALAKNNMLLNSMLPAMALCAVKQSHPDQGMKFAENLLKAFYQKGISSDDILSIAAVGEEMGIEGLSSKLKSEAYEKMALKEFESVAAIGVKGYPALVIEIGGELSYLSNGYTDYESLVKRFQGLQAAV